MKKWAIVHNGRVVEVVTAATAPKLHPDLVVIDATAVQGVAIGWRHSGTEFTAPPPSPPPLALRVAASSAKLVLLEETRVVDGETVTLFSLVKAMILAHPLEEVRVFWDSANEWLRDNAYVLAIGAELGLTEEQMDELFRRAVLKV